MLSDHEVEFSDRRYGKNYVRLLHVRREGSTHFVKEIEVNSKLTLADTKDFVHGDNSSIVATDSQKNTIYILAKKLGVRIIEEFAQQLTAHFLKQYSHVTVARVFIKEQPWRRIQQGGREHVHAFVKGGDGVRFCEVEQFRNSQPSVSAGIQELTVMKTTKSAFVNFVRDEFRSLPDMDDRVFATTIYTRWSYSSTHGLDYNRAWDAVKNAVLDTFAGPPDFGVDSPSVQKTLYDTQKLALAKVPQMAEIEITLPNIHAYEFDLSRFPAFGFTKNGEVFQPTDKPSGNISATLRRKFSAKL